MIAANDAIAILTEQVSPALLEPPVNVLRIALHPDVLPFSNIPAWLPPFLLDPGRAMTVA